MGRFCACLYWRLWVLSPRVLSRRVQSWDSPPGPLPPHHPSTAACQVMMTPFWFKLLFWGFDSSSKRAGAEWGWGRQGEGDIIQGPGRWGQGLLASSAGTMHSVCGDKAGAQPADVFMRLGWTPPQQAQRTPWRMIKISLGLWDPLRELNGNNWKALRTSHWSWKLTDSADLRSSVWICWSWRISAIWKF